MGGQGTEERKEERRWTGVNSKIEHELMAMGEERGGEGDGVV